jgi:hypothetical protein
MLIYDDGDRCIEERLFKRGGICQEYPGPRSQRQYSTSMRKKTDASKTPNDMHTGVLSIRTGVDTVLEQLVRPVSTLYSAFGRTA